MNKDAIIINTRNAFDFIQKLYLEVSYLVKEIEGLLNNNEEKFVLGRTSGYAVTALRSAGLEPNNVNFWLTRRFSVFFIPERFTHITGGVTETQIDKDLKVLYMRFVLDADGLKEPTLYVGVLFNFEVKPIIPDTKKFVLKKFEQLVAPFEARESRLFTPSVLYHFEDPTVNYNGMFFSIPLFDLESPEIITTKVLDPALELYREGCDTELGQKTLSL